MRAIEFTGWVLAALPDGTERRPSNRLPPQAARWPEPPSLESVGLQVCCPGCARRAYRFIAWWDGARHVSVRGGALLGPARCNSCGAGLAAGDHAVVFVLCPDTRVAARCLALLCPGPARR